MNLFQRGNFLLNSGEKSFFKIDCDAISNEEITTLGLELLLILPCFSACEGIPTGGLRLADWFQPMAHDECILGKNHPILIIDDVLTTGKSMEKHRWGRDNVIGAVLFSRGKCPDWVTPLFQMTTKDSVGR